MTPHEEQAVCLKEGEWKEVHEFVAGTKEYRLSLDKTLGGIKHGMWAVALAVLIPFIMGMIWIGEMGGNVKRNTHDIERIDARLQAVERGTQVSIPHRMS